MAKHRISGEDGPTRRPLVKPTLIIGLGGSGVRACHYTRQFIQQHVGPTGGLVRYLCFDTDLHPDEFGLGSGPVDDFEFTDLLAELDLGRVVRSVIDNPMSYPHASWLQGIRLNAASADRGAQGIPRLGRLVFALNREHVIRPAVERAIADLQRAAGQHPADRLGDLDVESRTKPDVHILSSVCGGTGAGMLIDMAYNVHDWVSNGFSGQPDILGHMLLPDVFEAEERVRNRLKAVAYATLQQIELLTDNARESLPVRYREIASRRLLGPVEAPFSFTFLVGGLPGKRDIACRRIGRMVKTLVIDEAGRAARSDRNNAQQQALGGYDQDTGRPRCFSTYGWTATPDDGNTASQPMAGLVARVLGIVADANNPNAIDDPAESDDWLGQAANPRHYTGNVDTGLLDASEIGTQLRAQEREQAREGTGGGFPSQSEMINRVREHLEQSFQGGDLHNQLERFLESAGIGQAKRGILDTCWNHAFGPLLDTTEGSEGASVPAAARRLAAAIKKLREARPDIDSNGYRQAVNRALNNIGNRLQQRSKESMNFQPGDVSSINGIIQSEPGLLGEVLHALASEIIRDAVDGALGEAQRWVRNAGALSKQLNSRQMSLDRREDDELLPAFRRLQSNRFHPEMERADNVEFDASEHAFRRLLRTVFLTIRENKEPDQNALWTSEEERSFKSQLAEEASMLRTTGAKDGYAAYGPIANDLLDASRPEITLNKDHALDRPLSKRIVQTDPSIFEAIRARVGTRDDMDVVRNAVEYVRPPALLATAMQFKYGFALGALGAIDEYKAATVAYTSSQAFKEADLWLDVRWYSAYQRSLRIWGAKRGSPGERPRESLVYKRTVDWNGELWNAGQAVFGVLETALNGLEIAGIVRVASRLFEQKQDFLQGIIVPSEDRFSTEAQVDLAAADQTEKLHDIVVVIADDLARLPGWESSMQAMLDSTIGVCREHIGRLQKFNFAARTPKKKRVLAAIEHSYSRFKEPLLGRGWAAVEELRDGFLEDTVVAFEDELEGVLWKAMEHLADLSRIVGAPIEHVPASEWRSSVAIIFDAVRESGSRPIDGACGELLKTLFSGSESWARDVGKPGAFTKDDLATLSELKNRDLSTSEGATEAILGIMDILAKHPAYLGQDFAHLLKQLIRTLRQVHQA